MRWNKFWVREDGKVYDEARRRRASQKAVLYLLVAFYVGYMGILIIKNRFTGDDTMSYPLASLLALILIISAIGVILYAVRHMKNEFEKSIVSASSEDEKQN